MKKQIGTLEITPGFNVDVWIEVKENFVFAVLGFIKLGDFVNNHSSYTLSYLMSLESVGIDENEFRRLISDSGEGVDAYELMEDGRKKALACLEDEVKMNYTVNPNPIYRRTSK